MSEEKKTTNCSMRISDVIRQLTDIKENIGDCPVAIPFNEFGKISLFHITCDKSFDKQGYYYPVDNKLKPIFSHSSPGTAIHSEMQVANEVGQDIFPSCDSEYYVVNFEYGREDVFSDTNGNKDIFENKREFDYCKYMDSIDTFVHPARREQRERIREEERSAEKESIVSAFNEHFDHLDNFQKVHCLTGITKCLQYMKKDSKEFWEEWIEDHSCAKNIVGD
jgi:hypothetical protein